MVKFEARRCSYIDSIGNPVDYSLTIPEDDSHPFPLVLFLHGCYREPLSTDQVSSLNESALVAFATSASTLGIRALFAAPGGYGNTRFTGIGCTDVIRVISEIEANYRVDPERISLIGLSMGGYGALNAAMETPGRFASIAVIGGYLDPERWESPARPPVQPWEEPYLSTSNLAPRVEVLRGTKLIIRHAEYDYGLAGGVPVNESRHLRALCEQNGVSVDYREWPTASHGAVSESQRREVLRGLLSSKKPSIEALSVWVGRWSSTSSFSFVRGMSQSDFRLPSRVELRREADEIEFQSTNVQALLVDIPAGISDVRLNRRQLLKAPRAGEQLLALDGRGTDQQPPRHFGWISDILSDHIAFVIPSVGDPIQIELFEEIASSERRRLLETNGGLRCGSYRSGRLLIDPPIMTDADFLRSNWPGNAIFYGNPGQNFAINVLSANTFLDKSWNRPGFEAAKTQVLRLRLPTMGRTAYVATLGTDLSLIAAGFDLDYGRAPGYQVFDRKSVLDWGMPTDRGLHSANESIALKAGKPK